MAQAIGGVDYLFQSTPPVRGATNDPDHAPNLWVFQSTPPVRGATGKPEAGDNVDRHFNPRPPCGGRLFAGYLIYISIKISIHAPRAGGDPIEMQ